MSLFSRRSSPQLSEVFQLQSRIEALKTENQRLQAIVSELDVTADGVPITPKTGLWQADSQVNWNNTLGKPRPWQCGYGCTHQRIPVLPVYSTSEAAREAELQS